MFIYYFSVILLYVNSSLNHVLWVCAKMWLITELNWIEDVEVNTHSFPHQNGSVSVIHPQPGKWFYI